MSGEPEAEEGDAVTMTAQALPRGEAPAGAGASRRRTPRLRVVTSSDTATAAKAGQRLAEEGYVDPSSPMPRASDAAARRRRRLLPLVLAILLTVCGLTVAATPDDATPPAGIIDEGMVVLGPGDTIWDVALAYAPAGKDPQEWVAHVVAHNRIDPASVQPGTAIRVPLP